MCFELVSSTLLCCIYYTSTVVGDSTGRPLPSGQDNDMLDHWVCRKLKRQRALPTSYHMPGK